MLYRVKIKGIRWDDGKGEYDVSSFPRHTTKIVEADSVRDAVDNAMEEMSDEYSMLIEDAESAEVEELE